MLRLPRPQTSAKSTSVQPPATPRSTILLMSVAIGMGTYFAAKSSTSAGIGAFLAMVAFNVSEGVVIGMDRRSNMERGCVRGLGWAWAVCAMEVVGILVGFGLLEVRLIYMW